MLLHFTKMHGLGNDFMVLDLVRQDAELSPAQIRAWADRRTGVGFDQLLVLEPPTHPDCDLRYRIFNSDGSKAEHCGNGARCVARFALDKGLALHKRLRLQLEKGMIETRVLENGHVTVDMGPPVLEPADIPFRADTRAPLYQLPIPETGEQVEIGAVSMGNPHAVLLVEDVDSAEVGRLGPLLEPHPDFPERVNVGFMQVVSASRIRLRVYERGAGETSACGTGACAAVVSGRLRGLLEETVTVKLKGGTLTVHWPGEPHPVLMTGPATAVYDGQIDL